MHHEFGFLYVPIFNIVLKVDVLHYTKLKTSFLLIFLEWNHKHQWHDSPKMSHFIALTWMRNFLSKESLAKLSIFFIPSNNYQKQKIKINK